MAEIDEKILGHKFRIEQYRMLQRSSELEDMKEWNDWRKKNPNEEIWLLGANFRNMYLKKADFRKAHCEGANFWRAHCEKADFTEAHCEKALFILAHCEGTNFTVAHCEGAYFTYAHCEGTNFTYAHCEGANFWRAHCEGTNFTEAHCEGTNFTEAHCEGADFTEARLQKTRFPNTSLSHQTRIIDCHVDEDTDFSNASLSSVIIEPGTKAFLERNIRRLSWKKWYGKTWPRKIFTAPMRFFWWLSDYGYQSKRIISLFFLSILFFALLYTFFPGMLMIHKEPIPKETMEWLFKCSGILWDKANFWQMTAFAASTMVTLGFSNINVAVNAAGQPHGWGMLVVTTNLMMGYFMLAVLVTRLAILFQTLGPGKVNKDRQEEKEE